MNMEDIVNKIMDAVDDTLYAEAGYTDEYCWEIAGKEELREVIKQIIKTIK